MTEPRLAPRGTRAIVTVLFVCAVACGAFLRLHLLSSQILLDDEWHSINHVVGRSFLDVATNLNPTENSNLPFNLYNWWLYQNAHWSESTLRLPSIVAGLLSLVLLPWMIGRVLGRGVALAFAFLLAVAPLLVFYSRFARAYSATALLGLAVVLLSHRWLSTGRTRDGVATVLAGTLAIYVHPESLVPAFVPLLIAFGALLVRRRKPGSPAAQAIAASPRSLLIGGATLAAVSLPVLSALILDSAKVPWAEGHPTVSGILTALSLISGTANLPLNLAFYALCVAGQIRLLRDQPLLGWIFLGVTGVSIALVLVSHPAGIGTGLVLLRYMIVVLPIALIGVAVTIEFLAARLARARPDGPSLACALVGATLAGCLYLAGPLPQLQHAPNNFTGHSAFQGSYEPVRWERSDARHVFPAFSMREDQVSPFYRWLSGRAEVDAIVEYPFDVCNHNDLFYYFQHVHGKRVLAGYCSDPRRIGQRLMRRDERHPDAFLTMLSADDILSRVPKNGTVAFRNLVDVTDGNALYASGADIVVLHKTVMGMRAESGAILDAVPVFYTSVDGISAELRQRFGPPVYEDDELVCFSIRA